MTSPEEFGPQYAVDPAKPVERHRRRHARGPYEPRDEPGHVPPQRRPSRVEEIRERIYVDWIRDAAPQTRLPNEGELSAGYAVSRGTLRAAMRSLQDAGFVSIRQGSGTVVLPQSDALESGIDQLVSFETLAGEVGHDIETVDLDMREIEITPGLAQRLQLRLGSRGLWVERAKRYADERVAWMVDFVPEETLAPEVVAHEFDGSVLDVLMGHPELDTAYADCYVLPVGLDAAVARRLEVEPGAVALSMDEITRSASGRPLAWGRSWMLPEHLTFSMRRRRRFVP